MPKAVVMMLGAATRPTVLPVFTVRSTSGAEESKAGGGGGGDGRIQAAREQEKQAHDQ